MIYTCYEMVRDCRAGKPEGWAYFLSSYVPLIRKLLTHYAPGDPALLDRVLLAMRQPESSLLQLPEPVPERWFLAELRQAVLAEISVTKPEIELDLETLAAALEPLTLVEKQAAWLDTMGYSADASGPMLRVSPETVARIRGHAAELIRGKVDAWSASIIADNGTALGRAAALGKGKDCLPVKAFLEILDGRTTWRGREEMEHHVTRCWHCIDHFCRMIEVVELLRGVQPLSESEAEPFRKLLGIPAGRAPAWKRWLGGA